MSDQKHVDPSALGLFGLAMVTLVASSEKLGITQGTAFELPWAIFLGALAQLVAGALDYKKKNVFGATAFCAYGFFWLGMASSWIVRDVLRMTVDTRQMGFAFVGYLILSIFLTVGAIETNKVLFAIFVCIDILFLGLSVSTFVAHGAVHDAFHTLAAVAELAIALLSFYGSGANVLNNHFGRAFLPIGKPLGIFVKPQHQ